MASPSGNASIGLADERDIEAPPGVGMTFFIFNNIWLRKCPMSVRLSSVAEGDGDGERVRCSLRYPMIELSDRNPESRHIPAALPIPCSHRSGGRD
jgi:hypothetical protein